MQYTKFLDFFKQDIDLRCQKLEDHIRSYIYTSLLDTFAIAVNHTDAFSPNLPVFYTEVVWWLWQGRSSHLTTSTSAQVSLSQRPAVFLQRDFYRLRGRRQNVKLLKEDKFLVGELSKYTFRDFMK